MSRSVAHIARRYWFADRTALAAIRDAEDAPGWGAVALPVTAFCLDDESHAALQALAAEEAALRVVDARDAGALAAILFGELDRETAQHVQFAFHAVEDFGPALDLLRERLETAQGQALSADMLAIVPFGMNRAPDLPERAWLPVGAVRKALVEKGSLDVAALKAVVTDLIDALDTVESKLIVGACYLTADELPLLTGTEREAALWRARTSAAWTEIDRLRSEKRIRAGREKALAARHERDLARQAERTRTEIDRLHRAAGWSRRWRARFARLFGR